MSRVFTIAVKVLRFHRRASLQWTLHVRNMVQLHARQRDGFVVMFFIGID